MLSINVHCNLLTRKIKKHCQNRSEKEGMDKTKIKNSQHNIDLVKLLFFFFYFI